MNLDVAAHRGVAFVTGAASLLAGHVGRVDDRVAWLLYGAALAWVLLTLGIDRWLSSRWWYL